MSASGVLAQPKRTSLQRGTRAEKIRHLLIACRSGRLGPGSAKHEADRETARRLDPVGEPTRAQIALMDDRVRDAPVEALAPEPNRGPRCACVGGLHLWREWNRRRRVARLAAEMGQLRRRLDETRNHPNIYFETLYALATKTEELDSLLNRDRQRRHA